MGVHRSTFVEQVQMERAGHIGSFRSDDREMSLASCHCGWEGHDGGYWTPDDALAAWRRHVDRAVVAAQYAAWEAAH